MAGDDPYASIIPLCHISSSQIILSDSDSDFSEAGDSRRPERGVSPSDLGLLLSLQGMSGSETPICIVSPPESPASGEKTEARATPKLGMNSESGGGRLNHIIMSDSELGEYIAWKRKSASGERLSDQINKGTEFVSLNSAKNLEMNDCTESVRADSKGKGLELVLSSGNEGLISGSGIAKNGSASIDYAEVAQLVPRDEGWISGMGGSKNREDADKSRDVLPNDSDFRIIPSRARVLPITMGGEWDSCWTSLSDSGGRQKATRVPPMSTSAAAEKGDSSAPSDSGSKRRSVNAAAEKRDSCAPSDSGSKKRSENAAAEKRDSCAPSGSGSRKKSKETQVPLESANAAANKGDPGAMDMAMSIVRLYAKKNGDPIYKNRGILDVAKLCGFNFPRPSWCGEDG